MSGNVTEYKNFILQFFSIDKIRDHLLTKNRTQNISEKFKQLQAAK